MRSATLGYHFANRSNRFWRVLHLSGFTPEEIRPQNAHSLLESGYGLTSAVERPTICANELRKKDFIDARSELEKNPTLCPTIHSFLGKAACSAIFNQRKFPWGPQPLRFGGAVAWVLPNPSGLNCAFTLEKLTKAYGDLFEDVIRR
jgi:TDG/mug DNA glycosylase family protein